MEREEIERLAGRRVRLSFEDIVEHPRLPLSRRAYLDAFSTVFEGDPFMIRLLLDAGRFFVFHCAAVLDAAHNPENRETWFTVSALKMELALFGFAGARQVDHLVRRLRDVGFLGRRPAAADRRVYLLAATEALWSHHARWLAAHYIPLATLFPDHDYGPPLAHDRGYHVLHCRWCLPFTAVGARLMLGLPDTMLFFSHSAGPLIANAILKSAMDSGDPSAAVRYQDAADRFGVSATHVRTLMRSAEAAGLVRLVGRGGAEIEILPRMWTSYDRDLAVGMYLYDVVNLVAMHDLAERRAGACACALGSVHEVRPVASPPSSLQAPVVPT